ncbi:hypothetical protein LUT86_002319 [Escherichia coli]|nr:hypothetical protein [Escherichia coli]EIQ0385275.1 hypothetical protein [Escherichia coli]EIQ0406984.1 hypothetical protein [Escherichia coli]EIQ0413847.1 hypothetical protein [Escherichia coli]EIQ0432610.1 hypothetical protein [Escherichia coli]
MTDNLPQTPASRTFQTSKGQNGRPTKYNERIAKQICLYIAEGKSLNEISKIPGMPCRATLSVWQLEHPELRRTIEGLRFIVATEYACQALECYQDLDPTSENIQIELAIAKAKAATLLGMARLHDLRNLPRPIQENEEC